MSRSWGTDELAVGNARRQSTGDPLARGHRPADELADQIVRIEHYRAPARRPRAITRGLRALTSKWRKP